MTAISAHRPFTDPNGREADTLRTFAWAILHGDDEHRTWLLEAAEAFIAGDGVPAARGKGTQQAARPDESLERLRKLSEAATPGLWEAEQGGGRGSWIKGSTGEWSAMSCGDNDRSAEGNADFIVAAVNHVRERLSAHTSQTAGVAKGPITEAMIEAACRAYLAAEYPNADADLQVARRFGGKGTCALWEAQRHMIEPALKAALACDTIPAGYVERSFPEAADGTPITDEEVILFGAGCDTETARFVARQFERQGFRLVRTTASPPILTETMIEASVGGAYEMQDGRKFWLDGAVAREIARRVLACDTIPAGRVLVPVEPTEAMQRAFEEAEWAKRSDSYSPTPTERPEDGGGPFGYGYRAMIRAAAPQSQEAE